MPPTVPRLPRRTLHPMTAIMKQRIANMVLAQEDRTKRLLWLARNATKNNIYSHYNGKNYRVLDKYNSTLPDAPAKISSMPHRFLILEELNPTNMSNPTYLRWNHVKHAVRRGQPNRISFTPLTRNEVTKGNIRSTHVQKMKNTR